MQAGRHPLHCAFGSIPLARILRACCSEEDRLFGKLKRSDVTEILILALAVLWVVGSLVASLVNPQGNWFCRSGAIMVLLSLFVEFRIGKAQQSKTSSASVAAGLGIPMGSDLPIIKQRIAKVSLWFAVLGTLIWGYGDLLA